MATGSPIPFRETLRTVSCSSAGTPTLTRPPNPTGTTPPPSSTRLHHPGLCMSPCFPWPVRAPETRVLSRPRRHWSPRPVCIIRRVCLARRFSRGLVRRAHMDRAHPLQPKTSTPAAVSPGLRTHQPRGVLPLLLLLLQHLWIRTASAGLSSHHSPSSPPRRGPRLPS